VGYQAQTVSMRQSAEGGPEAFFIYDHSSAPSADDYIIDADYPIETYLYNYPAAGTAVSYAQNG
jgi:hypothetical protein